MSFVYSGVSSEESVDEAHAIAENSLDEPTCEVCFGSPLFFSNDVLVTIEWTIQRSKQNYNV